jgi:integrase
VALEQLSINMALEYITYLFDAGYGYDTPNKFRCWLSEEERFRFGAQHIAADSHLRDCLKGYRNATLDLRQLTEPIRLPAVRLLLTSCRLGLTAKAMAALAYACCLRYSEVQDVLLGTSWLEWVHRGWLLHLSRSKNDPLRCGTTVLIKDRWVHPDLIPHLERVAHPTAPWDLPSRRFWSRLLRGPPAVSRFHGFRHGRATDLIAMGVPKPEIMFIGRWKSLEGLEAYEHV